MRDCGDCTLCCTLCVVPELDKPAGVSCERCTGTGCGDYENRPQSCRDFECSYYQAGGHVALRPDNCGVVFERTGDVMFGTADLRDKYPHVNGQIQHFVAQGAGVVMNRGGKTQLFNMADKMDQLKEVTRGGCSV